MQGLPPCKIPPRSAEGSGRVSWGLWGVDQPEPENSLKNFRQTGSLDKAADADETGEDYFAHYRAPGPETGTPLHALNSRYYDNLRYHVNKGSASGEHDAETHDALLAARGNPDHPVTIYRSTPPEHSGQFNTGDWVSTSRAYAASHGSDDNDRGWPVTSGQARAGDLYNDGNSLQEYGYHGPAMRGDSDHHTASTDGIRYAHLVESDVADDLLRLAMPSQDAYDDAIMDSKRKTDDIPEQGEFYHGSNHEHQPGDILESVNARGDQDRMDYYRKSIGAPNHADWVWMYNHPAPATKYHKHVYQLEPLDEGPWIWNNIKRDDGQFRPTGNDEDFPRLVSPRARVVRKLTPDEHAAASKHLDDFYEKYWADQKARTARLAMPAPLPGGMQFRPFERGDETSQQISWKYPNIGWKPGPGVAAYLPGDRSPVGHIEWLSDNDADEAEQYGEPPVNPGEVSYINVDDNHRRHSIGTELFDQARAHEPRVHHSQDRTELGQKWIDHEQSRQTVNARLAMAWQDWAPQIQHWQSKDEKYPGGSYYIQHRDLPDHPLTGVPESHLDYDYTKPGEVNVSMLYTHEDHRNDGVAEALMRKLHEDHPGYKINPGQMTSKGQAFHDRMLDKEPDARGLVTAGRNGEPPPMTFEPFNTMWSNGIMARHAEDGRPLAHLHWYPDGEIETIRVHPQLQGRDIAKHVLAHAAMNPDTYEAEGGIKPSNHLTPAGRAFAQSLGHNPSDAEVTPAEGEDEWAWKAVDKYVPMHVPYNGQNEAEMSKHLDQPWTPPAKPASADDEGWPVWWRGRHRPAGPFDKRWHPNHPEHIPAPWAD